MAGIWVPWLADAARLTGYPVVEITGWRSRGHGGMTSVEGVVLHHTAGPRAGEYPSLAVVRDGRAGLAGPLSHLGLGRSGTVYVIAAGTSWHAGESRWLQWTGLNSRFLGVEAEDDGDGRWTREQLDCYPRLVAALLHYMRRGAARAAAHREVALPAGRKPDPAGIDMPSFRRHVAHLLTDPLRLIPRGGPPEEDDMFTDADRALMQQLARRDDVGHARNQVLSRLGVADPVTYPARRTPEDLAAEQRAAAGPPALTAADHDAIARRVLALLTEHPLTPKGTTT